MGGFCRLRKTLECILSVYLENWGLLEDEAVFCIQIDLNLWCLEGKNEGFLLKNWKSCNKKVLLKGKKPHF